MGLVDCIVFCIRERPWREIGDAEGRKGSFWASFVFWKVRGGREGWSAHEPRAAVAVAGANPSRESGSLSTTTRGSLVSRFAPANGRGASEGAANETTTSARLFERSDDRWNCCNACFRFVGRAARSTSDAQKMEVERALERLRGERKDRQEKEIEREREREHKQERERAKGKGSSKVSTDVGNRKEKRREEREDRKYQGPMKGE
jgi:hypothetical protein